MSALAAPPDCEPSCAVLAPRRYELRIRTVVSRALMASFPVPSTRIPVRRNTTYRVRVSGERDIADVVKRLAEAGVEVLDIRRTALRA